MFIGLAYTQQENWAEANESYSMALRAIEENGNGSSPLLSDIYSNKALCASRQGDSEEAHRLCRLAKELAPRMQSPTCSRDASIWKRTISTWPVQSGH